MDIENNEHINKVNPAVLYERQFEWLHHSHLYPWAC